MEAIDVKIKFKKIDFRSRKGMTLTEMLIGIAVASVIMIGTITLVNYSFTAYSQTQSQITNDTGLYDTTDIINKYIREAEFCSVKDENTLYLSIDNYSVGGVSNASTDVRFIYDETSKTLLLDKMDGSTCLTIANYIDDVKWEVYNNGVRYIMHQKTLTDNEPVQITGFAYSRGR